MSKLKLIVKNYDVNANRIEDRDVLKYSDNRMRKLKKTAKNKDEFWQEFANNYDKTGRIRKQRLTFMTS